MGRLIVCRRNVKKDGKRRVLPKKKANLARDQSASQKSTEGSGKNAKAKNKGDKKKKGPTKGCPAKGLEDSHKKRGKKGVQQKSEIESVQEGGYYTRESDLSNDRKAHLSGKVKPNMKVQRGRGVEKGRHNNNGGERLTRREIECVFCGEEGVGSKRVPSQKL